MEQQLYGHSPPILQTIQNKQSMLGTARGEEMKITNDVFLWTPTHGHTSVDRVAKILIHQVCSNNGCCLDDLPR